MLWNRRTGEPVHHALVWQDTRVEPLVQEYARSGAGGGPDAIRALTGLPLASYFSALKLQWLLDNVPGARDAAMRGELLFGTMDCWVTWNLTGGTDGGLHVTDVTNASRTQLMNLSTLEWDDSLLEAFRIPRALLPRIVSSSTQIGSVNARIVLRVYPLRAFWAISRRRWWVNAASLRVMPRTPMAPAVSC